MNRILGLLAALTLLATLGLGTAHAANWTTTGGGDWFGGSNWDTTDPTGEGAVANLTANIGANATITLNAPATVGSMTIADSTADYYSYIVSGANTLTFDNTTAPATLTVSRGTANLIGTPVALNDNLSLQLSNASRIEFSGQLSGAGKLRIGPSGTESPPNTYVRLSADNSSYAAGFELLGGANAASPRLEVAHANALGSGDITGVNWYGGWLENVIGSTLTLNNTINGTRMTLAGNPFVLAGDIDLTGSSPLLLTYANVTLPNGLPRNLTLLGYSGSTVKIEGASAGDLTISSSSAETFRLEFDHNDGLGPNHNVSLGTNLRATLVPLVGPRTVGKGFTAHTWSVNSSQDLTLTGDISTSYYFGKAGTGLVVLSGASNTWGTVVELAGGVFRPETASAMPTSNIRFNSSGGVLELTPATGDFTRPVGTLAGQVRWLNASGGGFSAYGDDRIVNLGGASATLNWNLNSFVGDNAALRLNSAYADSAIDFQNPIDLHSGNENTAWRTIYVDDNPNSTGDYAVMSGVISSSSSRGLIKQGPGLLVLTADNTYTRGTDIQAGTLSVGLLANGGVASGIGQSSSAASSLVLGGGTLQYTGGSVSTNRSFTLTAATTSGIEVTGAGTNLTISGASANTTGGLFKSGAGTLTLTGANLHTGLTDVRAGTLAYGANNALSSGPVQVSGGTLDIGGYSDTVGAVTLVSGSIAGTTGVLTGSSYEVQSGAVSAILGGSGALAKTTGGTVILSGANTYAGGTTVSGGILLIASDQSAATGPLTVANATVGGSGIIGGTVTVNAGGTLSPGASIESLGSGALTLNDGSTFAYELDTASLNGDLLYVTGGVAFDGTVTLTLAELAAGKVAVGDKLTLIASTDPWSGSLFTYEGSLLADGTIFDLGVNKWQFAYNDTTGGMNFAADQIGMNYFITMTAIPEPTAGLLLALAGALALRRRRR